MPTRGVPVPSWALLLVPLAPSACVPLPTQTRQYELRGQILAQLIVGPSEAADRSITHTLRTAVLGPDGRIVAACSGGDWTTTPITDDLRNSLAR